MLNALSLLLRKIRMDKPRPVKYYRKEDLDFIFTLYNTPEFTEPFRNGDSMAAFTGVIKQLYESLLAHRHPDDEENRLQANAVFRNLGAIMTLGKVSAYDGNNWRCFAIDALRFNCSEMINEVLDEYSYEDCIHNHKLYTDADLVRYVKDLGPGGGPDMLDQVRDFLNRQQLPVAIAEDYYAALKNHDQRQA